MKKLLCSFTLLLTLSLLNACGFTLRTAATANLAPELQVLQVISSDGTSAILQTVQRALRNSGVSVIESSHTTAYQLNIGREQLTERVVSVSSSARAGEYELTMSLPFQLSSAAGFMIAPDSLNVYRSYTADPSNAVAKAQESSLIKDEMRQALARQLLLRLQNLNFESAATPTSVGNSL